jgi:hypothetical protein
MKNVFEIAATMYIVKCVTPFICAGLFVLGISAARFMDKVTESEYKGTKLKIKKN